MDNLALKQRRKWGIDDYSPISFDNLADLLYNVSDEYAIGYFEDKNAIISAFNDCDLYK